MKLEAGEFDDSVVTLDLYNSDLNLVIDASRYTARPLTSEGFAFMWAGARSTHGISSGKCVYEVKILEHIDVSHLPADEPSPHVVRVGFSVDSSSLQLGEDPLSYGYGGTAKISTNCQFKDYGSPFIAGDVVLAILNMESDPVQIGFAKNGSFLGWAYRVNKSELKGQDLFPHILTKNCSFEVNFGQKEKPYFPLTETAKNFSFLSCIPLEQRILGAKPPITREECVMIMMCGLPGAGKSVWAEKYSKENPEKKFNVLGTNNIIDKMKVMGLPRKRNYHGRWEVLIQMATKCLNKMFEIGSKMKRNYILDQTNVYPSAQRRKMRNFDGFKRMAVVVVPSQEEYKKRCDKRDREEGKLVPDQAVLEMKANFKLPEKGDIFDEIIYSDLDRPEAEKLVSEYNDEGRSATGPPRKQFRPDDGNRGFDSGRGRGGFSNRGGYSEGRGDFPRSRGGMGGGRGGFDDGRSGYDAGRGGYNGGRGGFDGGRGGYDGGRGGFDSGRSGYDFGRSGYDDGRGAYDDGRGGYDGGRGGYEFGRSSYDGGRGGYDRRGGFDSLPGGYDGGRGGYDGGRGGFDGRRGGYDDERGYSDNRRGGGYESGRGGRGGYEGGRGANRGSSRGGYESGRSGYGGDRGGYDGGRSGDRGRGGFDRGRGSYSGSQGGDHADRKGGFVGSIKSEYDTNKGSGYDQTRGGYSNDQAERSNYGDRRGAYDDSRRFESTQRGRGGHDSQYGRSDDGNFERKRSYADGPGRFNSPQSSARDSPGYGSNYESPSGFGDGRGQGNFGGTRSAPSQNRGGYQGNTYGSGNSPATGGYGGNQSSGGYTGGSTQGTSGYGSGVNQSTGGYAASSASSGGYSSSYATTPQRSIKTEPEQSPRSGSYDNSSQRGRSGGRPSRWSAETTQTETSTQNVASYSSYNAQVKPELTATAYSSYSSQPSSYTSYVPDQANQGYQVTQSYGYQQSGNTATTPQNWTAAGSYGQPATQDQGQWPQGYQQAQSNQYYSQYYGQ